MHPICRIAPDYSGDLACVKSEDVKTSQRTDLAVCKDEHMVQLNVGSYNTLLIVHVDSISSTCPIPNGY